jgi:riboflavin synthase
MFTGLIQHVGDLLSISEAPDCTTLHIDIKGKTDAYEIGESVSVNGVCLTVTRSEGTRFEAEVSKETLSVTTLGFLKESDVVNLEFSLTPTTKMGGHFVTGHVDEVGTVSDMVAQGDFSDFYFSYSSNFEALLVDKGSITVNGVSLTVVKIGSDSFHCHVIGHTRDATNFSKIQKGDRVNVEYDILGKYLWRFSQLREKNEKNI